MKIKALKGVHDILPTEIHQWMYIEESAQKLFLNYGYEPLRIPIIEETSLFTRSIGQQTDIVAKEMYTFIDKGLRSISLRPEATAIVVRAYLEHNYDKQNLVKFSYAGPMFRGEKPQSGRNRQFYQLGVEALGSDDFRLDAEIIVLADAYLKTLGLKNYKIIINSVGCICDKDNFSRLLKKTLIPDRESLCENCQIRLENNVLRILDCKVRTCKKIVANAPKITEHLCPSCDTNYTNIKETLNRNNIEYQEDPQLVRGLDYYTKTVFEITHADLGAQNAIGAGGRYNNLIKDLGGPDKGATGFAFGVERLLLALNAEGIESQPKQPATVYAIALGDNAADKLFDLIYKLRTSKISAIITYEQKSLKAHMKQANKLGCAFAVILGDNELFNNTVLLRDMESGEQQEIPINLVVNKITSS